MKEINRSIINHEANPEKRNRIALTGIILVSLALRPSLVSIGPSLAVVSSYFGMSHAAASLLISIPDLLMGLLALPTPWLVKKFGRNNLVNGALLLLAAATFTRAYVPGVATLLLCTAGVGTGIAIAGTLLSGFVKATFPARAALVMGIYSTSLSLGSTLAAVTTAPILKLFGNWRIALGIWTIPAIIGLLAWLVVTREERKTEITGRPARKVGIPWKNPVAWRIAIFFACVNFIFYSLLAWTAPLFIEHGLSTNAAGFVLGCFTFFFMLSSPVFGTLSRLNDRRGWLFASSLIALTGLLVMTLKPDFMPFVIIAVMAFGLGGAFTLGMTLPLDHTSHPEETNAWTAFILTVGYLFAACGPLLLGALRDYTGGFVIPILTLVGVAVVMLLVALTLRPATLTEAEEKDLLLEERELLP